MDTSRLQERVEGIRHRVHAAAERGGRSSADVRLVAVTKGHPVSVARMAAEAGLLELGENRVEELAEKVPALMGEPVRWHMIGRLQRRKAPRVRELAHMLHSLDSVALAERLERTAPEGAEPLPVLVQVNTAGEEEKTGFEPEEFLGEVETLLTFGSLKVEGLMTMAPFTDDERVLRDAFRSLRELHEEARTRFPNYTGVELSMGMSNDFELAVEEGSTMVRLGTVLFGEREG